MIKRDFRYFDWLNLFLIIILSILGIILIYSASYKNEQPYSIFLKKQIFAFTTGLIIFFIFSLIDYKLLYRLGYLAYFALISLLIFTLIKGKIGGLGAQRWMNLGIFSFQPSELAKIIFPAFVSYFLETQSVSPVYRFSDFTSLIAILSFTCLLILKQPHLGTAIIILLSGLIMFWIAGIKKSFFMWTFLILIFSTPITWKLLRSYQKKRIAVFLGQGENKKERYQIEQSTIAIGSGGLIGKGFLKGTQNRLDFLPEGHTDFIFSVLCEEFGLIGAIIILILYSILFFRILYRIKTISFFFAMLLAVGLIVPIIISTIINISMVLGLLPTVGIPLPFLSYGITHSWVNFAALGWINSIIMRNS